MSLSCLLGCRGSVARSDREGGAARKRLRQRGAGTFRQVLATCARSQRKRPRRFLGDVSIVRIVDTVGPLPRLRGTPVYFCCETHLAPIPLYSNFVAIVT